MIRKERLHLMRDRREMPIAVDPAKKSRCPGCEDKYGEEKKAWNEKENDRHGDIERSIVSFQSYFQ